MQLVKRIFRPALPVNDVSTSYGADLPKFLQGSDRQPRMEGWTRWFYADCRPVRVRSSQSQVADVRAAVQAAAAAMPNWTLRAESEDHSSLQYLAVTPRMKFKDDVVIRITLLPDAGDVVLVDMRSRSRLGKGDMGANGARILQFQRLLAQQLSARSLARL